MTVPWSLATAKEGWPGWIFKLNNEMQWCLVSQVPSKPPVVTRFKDLAVEQDLVEVAMTNLRKRIERIA